MQWILPPLVPNKGADFLGCAIVEPCSNLCIIQWCPGKQCSPHLCGVYISAPGPM
mgnify:CR=1 FL=1